MKRLALCVGINNYPGTGSDLSGCINDSLDWDVALTSRGYATLRLVDKFASKEGIVRSLKEGLDQCRFGDRFVFCFSGHGTWVPDKDGDEADQRDEALCCYDFYQGGLITDDELNAIFSARRRGVRVTVISDSCHSGTMSRFVGSSLHESGSRIKFLRPLNLTTQEAALIEKRTRVRSAPRPGTVLISGCQDHEYSYDSNFLGRPNGAMTYHLLQVLKNGDPSVKGSYELLRERLPNADYPQTPQLAATYYQKRTALL